MRILIEEKTTEWSHNAMLKRKKLWIYTKSMLMK